MFRIFQFTLFTVVAISGDASRMAAQITSSPPVAIPEGPAGTENNPAKVSSGIIAGNAISQPRPIFGRFRCGMKVSGTTVMRVVVDPTGKVNQAEILSGPEDLRQSWLEAVRKWTYRPYLIEGKAVWVRTIITGSIQFGACDPND